MSASLVGSEMCIRDRSSAFGHFLACPLRGGPPLPRTYTSGAGRRGEWTCLLYTSDAADDM
eukprot:7598668-Alexandrium_andersonii.AAC.1